MPKSKYKFDPESLSYKKIVLTRKQLFYRFLKQMGAVAVVSAILLSFLSLFFDTPGEKQQKRENAMLRKQYENLNNKLTRMEREMNKIEDRDNNIYRLIFGTDPISEEKRLGGSGGVNKYKEFENLSDGELVINTSKKIDRLTWQLGVQWESYEEVIELAKENEKILASRPAISPISDKDLTRFASGFGYRIHPIYRTRKMHTGIDLTTPTGTPVYATGDGKILIASYAPGGYGKRILIDHGFGYKTLYAHLHKINVKVGQTVKRGEKIGEVGNTGRSTAPHLHYEVRKNNKFENPVNYYFNDLTPEQYEQVLRISNRMNMSFD